MMIILAGVTGFAHRRVLPLIVLALFATISGTNASFFDKALKVGGRVAEKSAETLSRATRYAQYSVGHAGVLRAGPQGQLFITSFKSGAMIAGAITIAGSDDLARLLSQGVDEIFVPLDTLRARTDIFVPEKLDIFPKIKVIGDEGEPALIAKKLINSTDALVVEAPGGMSYSLEAWGQRALLDQSLMKALWQRMRVVVIAPKSDVVQRKAYSNALGSKARFVETASDLKKELDDAHQRLVVVVGHVENSRFVLREVDGRVVLNEAVADVHQALDQSGSIGVMMGCNTACSAPVSGPTTVIDAMDAAMGLSSGILADTPSQFLQNLNSAVGPLHVDTDLYGRLRAVSAATITKGDIGARALGGSRVLFPSVLERPFLATDIFWYCGIGLMLCPFGWFVLLLCGISPSRADSMIKEFYAAACGRDDSQIERITQVEAALLMFFGPAALLALFPVTFPLAIASYANLLIMLPALPFFWLMKAKIPKLLSMPVDSDHWIFPRQRAYFALTAAFGFVGALATSVAFWIVYTALIGTEPTFLLSLGIFYAAYLTTIILLCCEAIPAIWVAYAMLPLGFTVRLPFHLIRLLANFIASITGRLTQNGHIGP